MRNRKRKLQVRGKLLLDRIGLVVRVCWFNLAVASSAQPQASAGSFPHRRRPLRSAWLAVAQLASTPPNTC